MEAPPPPQPGNGGCRDPPKNPGDPPQTLGDPPPTRWGICAAGKISHDFVVALGTLDPREHQVVAVAARELSRAEAFARRHGVKRAYGGYSDMAEDPEVDVVYVGTVNPQHLPAGLLFLAAGKAVLMEKPMGLSAQQVRELVVAARRHRVFLMEGFWTRFFPAWRRLRALAQGGDLGDLKFLRGALAFPMEDVERLREPELGGGALLDLGGYGLQMAVALMGGAPLRLHAQGCLHPTGVDETATLTLEFPGRRQAVLSCSMAATLPGGAALGGTRGWAEFPSHMNCPTELVVGGQQEVFPLPPPPTSEPPNFPHGTGLRYEAQHVRECLLGGLTESPEMPLAESELIARLLDEARGQLGVLGALGGGEGGEEGAPSPTD